MIGKYKGRAVQRWTLKTSTLGVLLLQVGCKAMRFNCLGRIPALAQSMIAVAEK
jgi:hypothetical protein